MKTRLLAMLAVFAMVFAGAAIIAQDNTSDAVDFDTDSAIDAYGRSANASHAIHYNTTGGMLKIVLSDTDYGSLTTPDVAIQVIVGSETVVYDPVSKAKEMYINMGAGTSATVKVAVHGSTFASDTIDFTLGAFSTTTINYVTDITEDVTATNGTLNGGVCTPDTTARNLAVSFTQTTGVNSFIGWAVSAEAAAAKTVAISSGASLETVLMGATLDTATYKVYAVWSNDSFTLNYDFNLPTMITTTRYVNTTSASTIGTEEAQAAFMTTGVLKPATLLVGGTDYVPFDYDAAEGTQSIYLAGYTFAGWWTSQTGGTQATVNVETPKSIQAAFGTDNLKEGGTYTLYAHWDAVNYRITYDLGTLNTEYAEKETPVTNKFQTVAYDAKVALMSFADLAVAKEGYVFSHWKIAATSFEEGALVSNLVSTWEAYDSNSGSTPKAGEIYCIAVYDFKVTIDGIATKEINFQPTDTAVGYEFLIDGDAVTKQYAFDIVFDDLLYNVTGYTVIGGTIHDMDGETANVEALTAYDNGKVSGKVDSITGPVTITLEVSPNVYKVTAKLSEGAPDSTGSMYVIKGEGDNAGKDVTVTWTNVVPNSKAGLVTFASTMEASYTYTVTTDTTGVTVVKISDKVFRIQTGEGYVAGTTVALTVGATATEKTAPIAAFYIGDINNSGESTTPGQVIAYITGERSEVPAGTFAVSGTVYKNEGGVTTYSVLTGSGTQSAVKQPGVHTGDAFVTGKNVGSGYNEYRIVFTTSDSYNVYAAKVTFTPTGGSTISTAEAIVG